MIACWLRSLMVAGLALAATTTGLQAQNARISEWVDR